MKKRSIALLAMVTVTVGSLLAGCGSGGAKEEGKAAASGKTELEFFVQKREAADTFSKIVEEFNNSQSEIVVKQNIVPDSTTVLMSRAATGDLPDIMQVGGMQDSNTMQFMKEGHFLDLTGEACLEQVVDNYKDSITYRGKNYVVPISANFSGVFYNKEKFEEAGYKVPKTYDELLTMAEEIKGKGEIPFLFPDKDSWTLVQCWEDNIDGSIRGSRKALYDGIVAGTATFQDDAIALESIAKVAEIRGYGQGDTLALGYDQAISDFSTGKSYMFMQGIWALPSIKKANPDMKIGMFSFPAGEGADTKVSMGIDVNIAIAATCKKPEAAKKFLEFIASKEMVQLYVNNDYSLPCIKDVTPNIPEAEDIVALVNDGKGVLQTLALPKAVSDLRQNTIQGIVLTSDATPADEFLKSLTDSFVENKQEYVDMYGE